MLVGGVGCKPARWIKAKQASFVGTLGHITYMRGDRGVHMGQKMAGSAWGSPYTRKGRWYTYLWTVLTSMCACRHPSQSVVLLSWASLAFIA